MKAKLGKRKAALPDTAHRIVLLDGPGLRKLAADSQKERLDSVVASYYP